jgi:FKBP-type peptidyl-prolyl cis-trans isomerase FklB
MLRLIRSPLFLFIVTIGLPVAGAQGADAPAMDDTARMHYALGYQLGRDLAGSESRPQALLSGLEDGRAGASPKLSQAEMEAAMAALGQRMTEQRAKSQAEAAKKYEAENSAFLAANAGKSGVKKTASGLQYKVVSEGKGRSPTAGDSVTVHYRGTLIDGTEFDSSYKRGEPATFPVQGVIAGWTEALQLMKEGAKYQLFIPPDLAYGNRGPLANRLLIFDVELLGIQAGADAAK